MPYDLMGSEELAQLRYCNPGTGWDNEMVDHRLTPSERGELDALKAAESTQRTQKETAERVLCQMWGVDWMADGSHWRDLRTIRTEIEDVIESSKSRRHWVTNAIATALGAIVTLAVKWIVGTMQVPK